MFIMKLKKIGYVLLGSFITSIGISLFLLPNKIVSGGVSGIGTLLYHGVGIQAGISNAVINALLLLIGIKILGKNFILNTVLGAGFLSIFIQFFSYFPPATNNVFLAIIFGSVLYGVGIGIALVSGGSTGGTDILGRIVQNFKPNAKIGKLLLIIDGLIVTASIITFENIDYILYGIIALTISTMSIDFLISKLNLSKLAFVISDRGDEICKKLTSTSPRGVTLIDVKGGYTMENKKMLVCALKDSEIIEFERKILKVDNSAFVIFAESQKIVGNGFYVYY